MLHTNGSLFIIWALAARIYLALLLLPAAVGKLRAPRQFIVGVHDYHLLPPPLASFYGFVMPYVELALAVLLLVGVALPVVGSLAAALLISFSLAIAINLRRGRVIACHCAGAQHHTPIHWGLVTRNLWAAGLALLVAGVTLWQPAPAWRDLWAENPLPLLSLVIVVSCWWSIGRLIDVGVQTHQQVRALRRRHQ